MGNATAMGSNIKQDINMFRWARSYSCDPNSDDDVPSIIREITSGRVDYAVENTGRKVHRLPWCVKARTEQ